MNKIYIIIAFILSGCYPDFTKENQIVTKEESQDKCLYGIVTGDESNASFFTASCEFASIGDCITEVNGCIIIKSKKSE